MDLRLELTGNDGISVEGTVVVELPTHFYRLSDDEIYETSQCIQAGQMIVACGRLDHSSDIDFMTGDGRLMNLKAERYRIPPGPARPIDHGHGISVGDYEVASDWMIDHATVIVKA